jgi:hypothetical protein
MRTPRQQVYAIVRLDEVISLPDAVSVTQILPTLEEAEQEVARLTRLNSGKGATYLWQATRFYPEGRKIGEDGSE